MCIPLVGNNFPPVVTAPAEETVTAPAEETVTAPAEETVTAPAEETEYADANFNLSVKCRFLRSIQIVKKTNL